jgi:hypothetical protein
MHYRSQFGEDAIVHQIFQRIRPRNKWCFEVGAANGVWLSNTYAFRRQGWRAALAESDPKLAGDLEQNRLAGDHVCRRHVDSIDRWLYSVQDFPRRPDFGSIDVDGEDYWLMRDMTWYRPTVLVVEFSPYTSHESYDPINPIPRGNAGQTAIGPLMDLAEVKGYSVVAKTFCNLILIDRLAMPEVLCSKLEWCRHPQPGRFTPFANHCQQRTCGIPQATEWCRACRKLQDSLIFSWRKR